jgi:hypothetical protein
LIRGSKARVKEERGARKKGQEDLASAKEENNESKV